MGISVQASGIGVQVDKFYLVNLNADPSMNALLVCYLKVGPCQSHSQTQVAWDLRGPCIEIASTGAVLIKVS